MLGILKPVSHSRMDEEGTKSAHKILNLNCQQGVAFCHDTHSLPFTNTGQHGSYQETMEKEHNIFPFIMVKVRNKRETSKTNALQLGLKMHSQTPQLQLLHHTRLIPQIPRPCYGLKNKSPMP